MIDVIYRGTSSVLIGRFTRTKYTGLVNGQQTAIYEADLTTDFERI